MLNFSRWAIAGILLPLIIGIFCALPSFLPDSTVAKLPPFMQTRVNLGLDLAGGSHLLLEASTQDVAKQRLANMEEQVRTELRRGETKIAIGDISSRDGLHGPQPERSGCRRRAHPPADPGGGPDRPA